MKRKLVIMLCTAAAVTTALSSVPSVSASETSTALPETNGKPRLLITQDGEVDDQNSLIHALLYSNDIDIEGIVQTSSKLHYSGDEENEPYRWVGTDWMYTFLDAYEEVYDNLIVHDPDYPTPDSLREITVIGNIKMVDDTSEETEGSNLIKDRILAEDERPLYIEVGGGANTVARALMSIEEEYKDTDSWDEIYQKVTENVILFAWGMQDSCYADYIKVNWPEIRMVDVSGSTIAYGYRWANVEELTDEAREKMNHDWMYENIESGKGALMDLYVTWGDGTYLEGEEDTDQYGTNEELMNNPDSWLGYAYQRYDFLSEGDTPAWLVTAVNGLRSLEDLSYGGWDGRYAQKEDKDVPEARLYQAAKGNERGIAAWVAAIQSDFATRASWCVAENYEDANHLPTVSVTEGLDLEASAGEEITLSATAEDPDGDTTTFNWYHYPLGDSYEEAQDDDKNPIAIEVTASGENNETATFTIPEDAKSGDTIHVIVEGIDGGGVNPITYQRVIITVK